MDELGNPWKSVAKVVSILHIKNAIVKAYFANGGKENVNSVLYKYFIAFRQATFFDKTELYITRYIRRISWFSGVEILPLIQLDWTGILLEPGEKLYMVDK